MPHAARQHAPHRGFELETNGTAALIGSRSRAQSRAGSLPWNTASLWPQTIRQKHTEFVRPFNESGACLEIYSNYQQPQNGCATLPLLDEGSDAFLVVVRREQKIERLHDPSAERLVVRGRVHRVAQALLDLPQGQRWVGGAVSQTTCQSSCNHHKQRYM